MAHGFGGWRLDRLLSALLLILFAAGAEARSQERDLLTWEAAGVEIRVYSYRPANCESHDILFVFHGLNRKAEGVRDKAARIAREQCLIVFSPLFDKDRFPNWRYHRAGVIRGGKLQPRARWTEPIFRGLLARARAMDGLADSRLYLFGHSAGGQFLSRISAYSQPFEADAIVVANPSVHVAPSASEPAPYGFGGFVPESEAGPWIRRYLALPISIYLGEKDTRSKNLVVNEAANRQGANRLLRGRQIFRMAKRVAAENDWAFNWRLVEADDVGHSSGGMLRAPELIEALGRQGLSPGQ